jgi:molybdopterin-binding protein
MRGPIARVTLACPFELVAIITWRSAVELDIETGARFGARFKAVAVVVIDDDTRLVRDINEAEGPK